MILRQPAAPVLDAMVDLETLGNTPGCGILSVGAVPFGTGWVDTSSALDIVIQRSSCAAAGLHEDDETLAWWDGQSPSARQVLADAANDEIAFPLIEGLSLLSAWLRCIGPNVRVWGNGADFDNSILSAAYRAVGLKPYWRFWNGRCYRTLKSLHPDIKLDRVGTHHRAVDDAATQAEHASRLLLAIKEQNNG